jgi:large subunit ribosomal protein L11
MIAAKKIKTTVKLNLPGGEASPAPPVGTALGQHGVNIMDFVKAYNEKTAEMKGQIVPAVLTIYEDRSFDFVIKKAPVSSLIKKALGIDKGSGATPKDIVGSLGKAQVEEIAREKMNDLNTEDVEAAMKIVEGTARSMGVKVEK